MIEKEIGNIEKWIEIGFSKKELRESWEIILIKEIWMIGRKFLMREGIEKDDEFVGIEKEGSRSNVEWRFRKKGRGVVVIGKLLGKRKKIVI